MSQEPTRKATKYRFDLIPGDVLRGIAEVFAKGAAKYGDNNWRKARLKGDKSPLNHALDHLAKYQAGIPDEDGDDNLENAIVNLIFERYYNLHPELYGESEAAHTRDPSNG